MGYVLAILCIALIGIFVPGFVRAFVQIWPQAIQIIRRKRDNSESERLGALPLDALFQEAQKGRFAAQYRLGLMYARGQGLPQDHRKANQWLLRAAEQDLPDAQYALAFQHEHGRGTTVDLNAAREWYRRAGENGHGEAACNLGLLYARDERFGSAAWPHAAFWLVRAAAQGVPAAIKGLKWVVKHIDEPFPPALREYETRAENGEAAAQLLMGWIAEAGVTGEMSIDSARQWYERARENGDIYAHVMLQALDRAR